MKKLCMPTATVYLIKPKIAALSITNFFGTNRVPMFILKNQATEKNYECVNLPGKECVNGPNKYYYYGPVTVYSYRTKTGN